MISQPLSAVHPVVAKWGLLTQQLFQGSIPDIKWTGISSQDHANIVRVGSS